MRAGVGVRHGGVKTALTRLKWAASATVLWPKPQCSSSKPRPEPRPAAADASPADTWEAANTAGGDIHEATRGSEDPPVRGQTLWPNMIWARAFAAGPGAHGTEPVE